MPEPKPSIDEDELDELPAIDGGDGDGDESAEDQVPPDDLDETPDDEGGGDPFDDSTGEDEPVEGDDEIDASTRESGWLDDAEDSDGLDVGTPEAFGAEEQSSALLEGAEDADDGEMDDELTIGGGDEGDERSLVGDAGEEGFEDEEEEIREEELPRLDADSDEVDVDDPADLLDALPDEEVSEEPHPPWNDRAWEVEGGPAGLAAVDALACSGAGGGLVVAGQGLARIDRTGAVTALEARGLRGGSPQSLAVDGDWIAVSTTRAGVLISTDGGKSFSEANGWRTAAGPDQADGALDLVLLGGDLWGRSAGGALLWSADRGVTWARVLSDRRFEAIAADGASGELVALGREGGGTVVGRGAGGRLVLSGERGAELPPGRVHSLAAQGAHVAVALGRGVFRVEAGSWTRLEGTAGLTALTFARGDGTLAIALHSEGEGRAWVLEARPGAPAFTVAELGEGTGGSTAHEDGDDARVRSLCWEASTGIVWAAGGFGLLALRPARG